MSHFCLGSLTHQKVIRHYYVLQRGLANVERLLVELKTADFIGNGHIELRSSVPFPTSQSLGKATGTVIQGTQLILDFTANIMELTISRKS